MDSDFSGEINSYYAEVVVLYYDNTSYAIILESIKADQEKISDCFPKGSIINIKFLFEYGEIFIYAESIGKQVLFDSDSNYIAEIGSI